MSEEPYLVWGSVVVCVHDCNGEDASAENASCEASMKQVGSHANEPRASAQ